MIKKICENCGRKISLLETCSCRHRIYDKVQRDKSKENFYQSKMWRALSEYAKVRANGLDEHLLSKGQIVRGNITHHIFTVDERPDLKFAKENLIYVSSATHNMIHNEYDKGKESRRKMQEELYKVRGDGQNCFEKQLR